MRFRLSAVLAAVLLALAPRAEAHFLWLSIRPGAPAGASRRVVGHFSEGRFDRTLPRLNATLERCAFGQDLAWSVDSIGAHAPLDPESRVVSGTLEYGIFDRIPSAPPALLVYDAKAAWSLEDAAQPLGAEVEICARRADDTLVLTVLQGGQPAAGAELVVVQDGRFGEATHETDAEGRVVVPYPCSPVFAARARVIRPGSGTFEGAPYGRVLRYATLCVERLAPLDFADDADPEAVALLNEAALRAGSFPADVSGVSGEVRVEVEGASGTVQFEWRPTATGGAAAGFVTFEAEDLSPSTVEWARDRIANALERAAGRHLAPGGAVAFAAERGAGNACTLALGDARTVRLEDHEVRELRVPTEGGRRVVALGEWLEDDRGRLLPVAETHAHFENGALVACESVHRTWRQYGDLELPLRVDVVRIAADASERRSLTFAALEPVRP